MISAISCAVVCWFSSGRPVVLVDNVVAKENVSRFVLHQGYQVQVEEQGDDFLLKITK